MKFETEIRGYATRKVTFEAESLEAAKEFIESGDGVFNWGEFTEFENLEFDEREAEFQLEHLEEA